MEVSSLLLEDVGKESASVESRYYKLKVRLFPKVGLWFPVFPLVSVWQNHSFAFLPFAAAAKLLQLCPTLCDRIDGSPPGSPVPGILQARTLEWVAMSFSNAWKVKVKVKSCPTSPHGLQPTRLLRPWDSPGKSTGVGAIAFSLYLLKYYQIFINRLKPSVLAPLDYIWSGHILNPHSI